LLFNCFFNTELHRVLHGVSRFISCPNNSATPCQLRVTPWFNTLYRNIQEALQYYFEMQLFAFSKIINTFAATNQIFLPFKGV